MLRIVVWSECKNAYEIAGTYLHKQYKLAITAGIVRRTIEQWQLLKVNMSYKLINS